MIINVNQNVLYSTPIYRIKSHKEYLLSLPECQTYDIVINGVDGSDVNLLLTFVNVTYVQLKLVLSILNGMLAIPEAPNDVQLTN